MLQATAPWRFAGFVAGLIVLSTITAELAHAGGGRIRYEIEPFARTGTVKGQLQTPRGGQPGSTTLARPTLDELGVTTAQTYGLRIRAAWQRHELELMGSIIDLTGDRTILQSDLISQADTYPAGTGVRSDTRIIHSKLTYRQWTLSPLTFQGAPLEIGPGVGTGLFGFRYKLDGDNGEKADRSYTDWVPNATLAFRWKPPHSRVSLYAEVGQSLTFLQRSGRVTDLFEATVRASYRLDRSWSFHIGIGYQHMFKKDGQTVPNRPHFDFGPWLEAGFTVRF